MPLEVLLLWNQPLRLAVGAEWETCFSERLCAGRRDRPADLPSSPLERNGRWHDYQQAIIADAVADWLHRFDDAAVRWIDAVLAARLAAWLAVDQRSVTLPGNLMLLTFKNVILSVEGRDWGAAMRKWMARTWGPVSQCWSAKGLDGYYDRALDRLTDPSTAQAALTAAWRYAGMAERGDRMLRPQFEQIGYRTTLLRTSPATQKSEDSVPPPVASGTNVRETYRLEPAVPRRIPNGRGRPSPEKAMTDVTEEQSRSVSGSGFSGREGTDNDKDDQPSPAGLRPGTRDRFTR